MHNTPSIPTERIDPGGWLASRNNWLLLIPLLLLMLLLTTQHLTGAFWVDEIITVDRAGGLFYGPRTPASIWEHTATTAYDQVPGYYILIALWGNLLGWSEFSMRLFSVFAGLLATALVYRLGREMHSPLAGLAAALTVGSSTQFIVFMHEARTYALAVLLAAIAIWCYWRIINGHTRWTVQAGLVLASTGLLYSHYFASLIVFTLCLYHLLFQPKNRAWWRVVMLMGLAGLLFVPWVLTSFSAIEGASEQQWRQDMSMTVPEFLQEIFGLFSNGNMALLMMIALLALHTRTARTRLIWFLLLGPLALAFGINLWLKMLVSSKFLLYLWLPLGLLVGVGTVNLARHKVAPVLLLLPWLLIGVWNSANWQEESIKYIEWGIMADQLRDYVQPEDAVVFHLHATKWDGAHQRAMVHYFNDFPKPPDLLWSWPEASDDGYLAGAYAAAEGVQRLWSSYDPRYRHQRVDKFDNEMLRLGFAECGVFATAPEMEVELFSRPPENMPWQFNANYADGIRMALVESPSPTNAQQIKLALGWQLGEDVPINTYSFGLHVLDASGTLVAQQDTGFPQSHAYNCQVLTTDTLPAGQYSVNLLVYAWETGDRLAVNDDNSGQQGDSISLGTFTVP